jgi:hypothetical protein
MSARSFEGWGVSFVIGARVRSGFGAGPARQRPHSTNPRFQKDSARATL